jgi:hypothetical protein
MLHGLIDSLSAALLAVSTQPTIVAYLASKPEKMGVDTVAVWGIDYPNYMKEFVLAKTPHNYPCWKWQNGSRTLIPTPAQFITDELRQRSALARQKCQALLEVGKVLEIARYPVWRELILQETIYLNKKAQAQKYKDHGYPENETVKYPYVVQYAEFSGLPMREAAEEILFKAQLDDERLAKTELLRLKYFNLIQQATDHQLKTILEQFRTELYGSGAV